MSSVNLYGFTVGICRENLASVARDSCFTTLCDVRWFTRKSEVELPCEVGGYGTAHISSIGWVQTTGKAAEA